MKKLFDGLYRWISDISHATASTIYGEDIDWDHIDHLRGRLVQMRFRTGQLAMAGGDESYMTDTTRENRNLGQRSFGYARQSTLKAIARWTSKDASSSGTTEFQKQLQETIYRKNSYSSSYEADDDWNVQLNTRRSDYEPLVLEGIDYSVSPTLPPLLAPQQLPVRGLIGMDFTPGEGAVEPPVVAPAAAQVAAPSDGCEMVDMPTHYAPEPIPFRNLWLNFQASTSCMAQ